MKIELERAEGPVEHGYGRKLEVATFDEASSVLASWARTAPEEGHGYDKCDFRVTWDEGAAYEGRVDLDQSHVFGYDLEGHIRSYLGFVAGVAKPDWMSEEHWVGCQTRFSEEMRGEARALLERLT